VIQRPSCSAHHATRPKSARFSPHCVANALSVTGVGYNTTVQNRRYEGKLTGRLATNHNLSLDFIKQSNQDGDRASLNTTAAMDLRVLVDRQTPSDLFIARYDGALSANAFVEAQ